MAGSGQDQGEQSQGTGHRRTGADHTEGDSPPRDPPAGNTKQLQVVSPRGRGVGCGERGPLLGSAGHMVPLRSVQHIGCMDLKLHRKAEGTCWFAVHTGSKSMKAWAVGLWLG